MVIMWKVKRSGLGEMRLEEEVRSLLARASGSTIWFSECGEVVDVLAVKHSHEAACLTWTRCPFHMGSPGLSTAPAAFSKVAGLGSSDPRAVSGRGAASLSMVVTFHPGSEVPEPLGKPGVVWVALVRGGHWTASIKGVVNGSGKLRDQPIQFLGGHRERDKELGGG